MVAAVGGVVCRDADAHNSVTKKLEERTRGSDISSGTYQVRKNLGGGLWWQRCVESSGGSGGGSGVVRVCQLR